jgi:hypothetical protein
LGELHNNGPEFEEVNPFIKNSEGRIFFYTTQKKSGEFNWVKIDGKRIGSTGFNWTFFYIDLPKGKYKISGRNTKNELEINILGGDTYYVEVWRSAWITVDFLLKDWAESKSEIRNCTYLNFDEK